MEAGKGQALNQDLYNCTLAISIILGVIVVASILWEHVEKDEWPDGVGWTVCGIAAMMWWWLPWMMYGLTLLPWRMIPLPPTTPSESKVATFNPDGVPPKLEKSP